MQKITETISRATAPLPAAPMTAGQLNRLDDESAGLVKLLHYPESGADFHRIIDACNELRYACLGTHVAAGDMPTDERLESLWEASTGSRFLVEDGKAFGRLVWSRAIASLQHLLEAGAARENELAVMIGDISDALDLTETEQFEANGADKILERIAALAAPKAGEADMRAICEALGFDPTNHHNAAKCPYCRPAAPVAQAAAGAGAKVDEALGIVELPPIRIDRQLFEMLEQRAKGSRVVLQAEVRRIIAGAFLAPDITPQPLTDERIKHLRDTHVGDPTESLPIVHADWVNFARAIERDHCIGPATQAPLADDVVDAEFPGTPTVAECIAQLDVWNGHLEAAIDRQALEHLDQHPNDEPFVVGRDPMEQLP